MSLVRQGLPDTSGSRHFHQYCQSVRHTSTILELLEKLKLEKASALPFS